MKRVLIVVLARMSLACEFHSLDRELREDNDSTMDGPDHIYSEMLRH